MKKITGILPVVLLVTIAVCCSLVQRANRLEKERDTYQGNTHALLSDMKRMRIDSATTAVDVKTLRLTVEEYKQYRTEDAEKLKKLGVKLNDLQMAAKHEIDVNAPVEADLKDSVIIRDTVTVPVKKLEMDTPFLQISGIIENNHLSGNIHLPVNLQQAVWIEPKHKFLWWRWGVKAVHQTISSDNPYVEIKYSEVIEIQK
ncbi:hypothetical protein FACS189413_18880 [Bacteroidia bacterium]|nr:hypothetical protein FACS189413_18880 [Bacteroidia bacterium]